MQTETTSTCTKMLLSKNGKIIHLPVPNLINVIEYKNYRGERLKVLQVDGFNMLCLWNEF